MNLYLLPMLLSENSHDKALTPHSIAVIKKLKVFFVEDVRTTRRFISSLKQEIVIDELKFIEITRATKYEEAYKALINIRQDVGVISEAGCAGIADPGSVLVDIGHQIGFAIKPLVGPSSILLALMGSGFNGQEFAFNGYLPIKEEGRAIKLRHLEKEVRNKNMTQIFMETPYRNNHMMQTILKTLNPKTKVCIATDLTSDTEYIKTKTVEDWKKNKWPDLHKRPTIFLIG